METQPASETSWSFKQLEDGQSYQKRPYHLMSVLLCCLFLTGWPLKIGPIGCPEMSGRNYHYMLHNIPDEHRYHIMIWQCRLWFGSAWSGLALCTRISDDLTYLSTKFQRKNSSCFQLYKVLFTLPLPLYQLPGQPTIKTLTCLTCLF